MTNNVTTEPALSALRAAELEACAGYLVARKAQMRMGARVASLRQLVAEQPTRTDYRAAWDAAALAFYDAVQRTRVAYAKWQRAQLVADTAWTASEGRTPPALCALDGKAA
ncbi:hypothetical protein GCM10012275_62480 [Longimycelium tulufanense]|uniref:Uncharacterized protein n=1 Tax=Longimycelium tulufanense TaxID=907463 RepID=A0A8J3FYM6_9PSEU|nr:hypothetical protein [Longimycelium tulufanense]GGM83364.1 hypothetical protein GCM10012275_62480 [Longimycelium tulufanense]